MVWIEFLICIALIGFGGTLLSRYGDAKIGRAHV